MQSAAPPAQAGIVQMMGVPQVMRFVEVANEDFKKSPPKK